MAHPTEVLLFGDQTGDPYADILGLFRHSKKSQLLRRFLQNTSDALQHEISELLPSERVRFVSFDSVLDLAEVHSKNGVKDAAVSTVLLCVAQLGNLIIHAEKSSYILQDSSDIVLLALCTGLLPAAAAATTRDLIELLRLAPEMACLSLRVGLLASHRSEQLDRSQESWAYLVSGLPADEVRKEIQEFHGKLDIPMNKEAYISAEANSSLTISGPPSTLEILFSNSEVLARSRRVALPITAAYHAYHLGEPDMDALLGKSPLFDLLRTKTARIFSTSSSTPVIAKDLRDLLRVVIVDILQKPLDWTNTVLQLAIHLGKGPVRLKSIGQTSATKPLLQALRTAGVNLYAEGEELQSSPETSLRAGSGAVAIVGMSGRFPGAETLEDFWKVLENGLDLHKKVPSDRFNVETHCDPSGNLRNSTLTPYGCFIDRPGLFDARLFNMSPREAAQTDPMQRLLLLTTYEALEMAGYSPDRTPATQSRRIGTFFGQTSDDWREVNASQDIDNYFITGGIRAFGPGRLNYHFKWEGPSYSLDTACSSSAASIQLACSALLSRECDTAIAGGTNIMTSSDLFAGLSRGSFLSPTGSCKTFDGDADGYCRGDTVGSIVLKRLEDAIADCDNIQAVIRAAVTNHSAHAISITHPHAETQEKLFRRVLQDACVEPDKVEYVEMHGTGTQAGDATEFRSVTNVFANGRIRDNPLYIGTVKPNIGHGEAASGVASIIKVAMMLRRNMIPPHVGIKGRINPKLTSLEQLNVHLAGPQTVFKAHPEGDGRRKVMMNNFDAAGGNTSILLQDPPLRIVHGSDPRSCHVVTISARTPKSLHMNMQRLLAYVKANPQTDLADLSYTTTARRMHHVFRSAHTARTTADLATSVERALNSSNEPQRMNSRTSVAFVFTGQGSHYTQMGKKLFDSCHAFRTEILVYNEICKQLGLPSFLDIITSETLDLSTLVAAQVQLATVSLELAISNLWQAWGLKPDLVIGHSLGEYPALCAAGVLSVSDMLFLVGKRAETMQSKCSANTHAMLAVQLSVESTRQWLSESQISCEIACINGPCATVVSGELGSVARLESLLRAKAVKVTRLQVPFAFHSSQLDPVLLAIKSAAQNAHFAKPVVPVASTLLGSVVTELGVFNAEYLTHQARQPVNFLGALQSCRSSGLVNDQTVWVETGPHPTCLAMLRSALGMAVGAALPTLKRNENCWDTISIGLATAYNSGANVQWSEYHREYERALNLLELPSYAFDLKDYWIQYQGDWALRKAEASVGAPPIAPPTAFSTSSLHRVENERFDQDSASVKFVSDLAEPKLRSAIEGHLVNGTGLCPSSVYADMAFTAASYIHSRIHPSLPVPAMDVTNMEVFQPLTARADGVTQFVKVSAKKSLAVNAVEVHFSSQDGAESKGHAHCTVEYGNGKAWMSEWARTAYLVRARFDHLVESSKAGLSHRILRPMVYKLFSTLVKYQEKYQGLEEVFLDSKLLEAAAHVKFRTTAVDGDFVLSPYWIDSIAHLSGFVLNGSDTTPEDAVYISHGWRSMRIAGSLSEGRSYKSYVRMQPTGSRGVMAGDVYLFDGDDIVAVCGGLKFQQIKTSILHSLLPSRSKSPPPRNVNGRPLRAQAAAATTPSAQGSDEAPAASFSSALSIIASEIGVGISELTDESNLADLGVDSLLTISILSKLRQMTSLDLPSSLFAECPTVSKLRAFLQNMSEMHNSVTAESTSDTGSDQETTSSPSSRSLLAPSTPLSEAEDVAEAFLSILAAETGVDASELAASASFADQGVDSLMSLSILSSFKSQTGKSLPASFFNDHRTLDDVRKSLGTHSRLTAVAQSLQTEGQGKYQATCVYLQGHRSSSPPLFLLPDGSGSASSYVGLPAFDNNILVYGLNSPFCASPRDYTLSLEAVARIYATEIRRQEPKGPYILGGWSIGGTYAYEVAKQLIAAGERIAGLILIDSPCPRLLPPLPTQTIDLLARIGVFDALSEKNITDIPLAVREHFLGSITALKQYVPTPLDPAKAPPKCLAIWARQGVWESVPAEKHKLLREEAGLDNKAQDWLMDPRKDLGPNGWGELLPKVECTVVEGNHFSIMRPPQVTALSKVIAAAVDGFPIRFGHRALASEPHFLQRVPYDRSLFLFRCE